MNTQDFLLCFLGFAAEDLCLCPCQQSDTLANGEVIINEVSLSSLAEKGQLMAAGKAAIIILTTWCCKPQRPMPMKSLSPAWCSSQGRLFTESDTHPRAALPIHLQAFFCAPHRLLFPAVLIQAITASWPFMLCLQAHCRRRLCHAQAEAGAGHSS
jgi:hypothetical protein